MADTVESHGQYMHEEATHELTSVQCHGLLAGASLLPIVLPLESDAVLIEGEQSAVGDCDSVGITGQVRQYRFRSGKGAFGINDPFLFSEGSKPVGKGLGISQVAMMGEEVQLTGLVRLCQRLQEQTPEQPRQHPYRQEEAGFAGNPLLAIDGEPAPGDDAVHMGMVGHGRAPGMQNQGCTHTSTQVLGVSRDSLKSHERFIAKHSLSFALAADPQESLCLAFHVIKEKSMYGKPVRGIERSTFLVDSQGMVRSVWRAVKVPGHAESVLAAARSLSA